jgi:hypothetical protein
MTDPSMLPRRFRSVALLALALLGGAAMSRPLSAQLLEGLDSAGRVIVSRSEVRVYFPPAAGSLRNSSVKPSAGKQQRLMRWGAFFDTPTRLSFTFIDSSAPQSGPPILSIVRAGRANLCRENMVNQDCSSANVAATLENGSIVLSYRDTAEIRQSFGLHPASVMLLVNIPPELGESGMFAAPVRYIDPPIRLDSAERTEVAREHRRREASINSYSRGIDGDSRGRPLSIAVGDSVNLWVQYFHCLSDVCSTYDFGDRESRDWGRWSLSDSSVATLHRSNILDEGSGFPPNDRDRASKLVALRPGRTTIRVTGVHTAADTMPSRTPLDSILEREIIATPARRRP